MKAAIFVKVVSFRRMSKYNKDIHSVILYDRIGNNSDVNNSDNSSIIDGNEEATSSKETKATSASFNTMRPSPNNPFDLNFLAIHSNEHIEREREKCWKTIENMFSSSIIPRYTGKSNYTRPQLPFLPWDYSFFAPKFKKEAVVSMFDKTFNAFAGKTHESDNSTNLLCIPESLRSFQDLSWRNSSSQLSDFVQRLRDELETDFSLESNQIQENVEFMLLNVFKSWELKYRMLKDFKLLKMGSTYEGTKIGKPNEFDFMVELPSLCGVLTFTDAEITDINSEPEIKKIQVIDRSFFADFNSSQDETKDDETFMKNVWNQVLVNICQDLQKNLLPRWKWLNSLSFTLNTLALTQQLLWQGEQFSSLIVDVDICMSVPQRDGNFSFGIDFNQDILDKRRPGITDDTEITENQGSITHVVLRSDGKARVTMAVREMMIWKMAKSNSKRSLYRCVKLVVSKFLPKTWNDELYRQDSIIPSYWLKTILFYMFAHYTDEKYWSDSYLPLRLVEVFFLLDECLHTKNLSSFFVPHNIIKRVIGEKERYSKLEECVSELNKVLFRLQLGDDKGLETLSVLGYNTAKHNEENLETSLYDSVVELLYLYGYNEYSSENMTAFESFISVFLPDRVRIEGEGKTIKIWYDGHIMDIDEEIHKRYSETQKYFGL